MSPRRPLDERKLEEVTLTTVLASWLVLVKWLMTVVQYQLSRVFNSDANNARVLEKVYQDFNALDIDIGKILIASGTPDSKEIRSIEHKLKWFLLSIRNHPLSGHYKGTEERPMTLTLVQQLISDIVIAIYTVRQLGWDSTHMPIKIINDIMVFDIIHDLDELIWSINPVSNSTGDTPNQPRLDTNPTNPTHEIRQVPLEGSIDELIHDITTMSDRVWGIKSNQIITIWGRECSPQEMLVTKPWVDILKYYTNIQDKLALNAWGAGRAQTKEIYIDPFLDVINRLKNNIKMNFPSWKSLQLEKYIDHYIQIKLLSPYTYFKDSRKNDVDVFKNDVRVFLGYLIHQWMQITGINRLDDIQLDDRE
jgi:hypothetical protein